MIIAIDFDGTIVEHCYPDIGKEMLFVFESLKQLQKRGHQLIGGIGPNGHKPARSKADLPAISRQDIKPKRGNRPDQKRHKNRIRPVIRNQRRDDQEGKADDEIIAPTIQSDRESLGVFGIGGLEIT